MKKQVGFTLVEMVIVIIIIGILAALAVPRFFNITATAHAKTVAATAKAFKAAVNGAKAQWIASNEPSNGIDYAQNGTYNTINCSSTNKWPEAASLSPITANVSNNLNAKGRADAIGGSSNGNDTSGHLGNIGCVNIIQVLLSNIDIGKSNIGGSDTDATDRTCVHDWCATEISTSADDTASSNTGKCRYTLTKDKVTNRYFTYNSNTGEVICRNCGDS